MMTGVQGEEESSFQKRLDGERPNHPGRSHLALQSSPVLAGQSRTSKVIPYNNNNLKLMNIAKTGFQIIVRILYCQSK